jgi:LCP family protein required for cell wall assembly
MGGPQDMPGTDPQEPRSGRANPGGSAEHEAVSPRPETSPEPEAKPEPEGSAQPDGSGQQETSAQADGGGQPETSAQPEASPAPERGRSRRGAVIRWGSVAVVCLLVIGALAGYLKYRSVWDSIHRVNVTGLGKRPPQYNSALNLLVFASGSTAGLTRRQQLAWHVGNDTGDAVSETIMIVHLSPGRHMVTVVNIPRDTVVPVYSCASGPGWSGQQADPGAVEQIDSTLSFGGPACLWKTVEQQTGIRISHFLELGYTGLVKVVDDIGGINVCVPVPVNDSYSGLVLSKGEHHIDGVTYLEFWRTREGTGDGSDLQRIQRDDYLLAQTLQQALHADLLASPTLLVRVVSDAAASLTTDSGLDQSQLLQIAQSLHRLPARDYQFIQADNVLYPPNPNWVQFAQPQADELFSAIAHDTTPARPARGNGPAHGTGTPSPAASPSAPASPAPGSPSPSAAPVRSLAQSHGGISGTASCSSDSGAFTGPLSPG